MGRVSAATTIAQLLLQPCTDFLPSPLGDGGKGDSWCVFLGCIPVAAPKGSMVCGTHLGQPEQQVRRRRMEDGGCSHSHQVGRPTSRNQPLLTGTPPQAAFSTCTGDSVVFPAVGGFTGSWSRPEIL